MNCKVARRKITDSFAAGATVLPPELTAHQESCATCRDFDAAEGTLFRSLDAGLESLVNEPMPPSLLPRVRARLEEAEAFRSSWSSRWSFVAFAAALLLALSLMAFWHRTERRTDGSESLSVASRAEEHPVPAVPMPRHRPVTALSEKHRPKDVAVPRKEASELSLEVIVLPEERAAFAKFVAQLPEEADVAVALTRAAPEQEEPPLEIALLKIEELEVKPLESAVRQ